MTVTYDQIAAKLRDYIGRAAAGETITIVEGGKAVAQLVGANGAGARLVAGAQAGKLRQPTTPKRRSSEIPSHTLPGKPASQIVVEDRR